MKKNSDNHLVFVYGSLKSGYDNHSVIEEASLIGEVITVDSYDMYLSGFPYLTKFGKTSRIHGELYEVTDSHLKGPLDTLEGHPDFYEREMIDVEINGEIVSAWTYIYKQNNISHLKISTDGKF